MTQPHVTDAARNVSTDALRLPKPYTDQIIYERMGDALRAAWPHLYAAHVEGLTDEQLDALARDLTFAAYAPASRAEQYASMREVLRRLGGRTQ